MSKCELKCVKLCIRYETKSLNQKQVFTIEISNAVDKVKIRKIFLMVFYGKKKLIKKIVI